MSVNRPHQSQGVPGPGRDEVAAQQQWAQRYGQQVGEDVLHRVSVESCQAHWSCPLVVDLVQTGVEQGAVEQDVRVIKTKLLHDDKDWQLQ